MLLFIFLFDCIIIKIPFYIIILKIYFTVS